MSVFQDVAYAILTAAGLALIIMAYWLPTYIARRRKVPNRGSVAVINFFFGWTIVGWIVALAMACIPAAPPAAPPVWPYIEPTP